MQAVFNRLAVVACLLAALLMTTTATAYEVTLSFNPGSSSIANGFVDNMDGTFTADLTVGDVIALDIFVGNATMDNIQAAFTSLEIDSGQMTFLGGGFGGGNILVGTCTGFGCTAPSLAPAGSPVIKLNSPAQRNPPTGTANWIQVVQHTSNAGTTGAGAPGTGDFAGLVGLEYNGPGGFDEVVLNPSFQNGDAVTGTAGAIASQTYTGITFNVPEPGAFAASLAALGSVALVSNRRRRVSK